MADMPAGGAGIFPAVVSNAAGISTAAVVGESLGVESPMSVEGRQEGAEEESPLLAEGSQVSSEENGISLEQLRVSEEMGVAGIGAAMNDEHKKQLIKLSKTCESHSLSVCLYVCLSLSLSVCLSVAGLDAAVNDGHKKQLFSL